MKKTKVNLLASALRDFFTDHLLRLRGLSPHTLHSYRDSLKLLLGFVATRKEKDIAMLDLDDIGVQEVIDFLQHLENKRRNITATRNVRLAAIHSFFRFVAGCHPEKLDLAQRVLSIPFKRTQIPAVEYLEFGEIESVLKSIDRKKADGRRDYALLATMFNTGARVQEIIDLRPRDLQLVKPAYVRLFGKGRKERLCPLWSQTAELLKAFISERGLEQASNQALFCNHRGEPLTRFGVRYILTKHCNRAKKDLPAMETKRLHPHSMRHSTAVHLLRSGVDLNSISQWLGHSSINTTNRYAKIDMEMKRAALKKADPIGKKTRTGSWRKNKGILEWLESL